ncbi:hypothetical protein AMTR_s00118p00122320 [Amborella trichopoda]|uniref:Uncharacterized protein n=1 Tax=Amborella trichopoda TaxID=13333 RepID=W1NSJ9_AMBTC|nr:hypothetical protein AMTR_s00118p00122320 [Amborella trichopoda]
MTRHHLWMDEIGFRPDDLQNLSPMKAMLRHTARPGARMLMPNKRHGLLKERFRRERSLLSIYKERQG